MWICAVPENIESILKWICIIYNHSCTQTWTHKCMPCHRHTHTSHAHTPLSGIPHTWPHCAHTHTPLIHQAQNSRISITYPHFNRVETPSEFIHIRDFVASWYHTCSYFDIRFHRGGTVLRKSSPHVSCHTSVLQRRCRTWGVDGQNDADILHKRGSGLVWEGSVSHENIWQVYLVAWAHLPHWMAWFACPLSPTWPRKTVFIITSWLLPFPRSIYSWASVTLGRTVSP